MAEGDFDSAVARWSSVGPYYAMFPAAFADRVVRRYTSPGDVVLDPFAGRGTAVFSAAAASRVGIGVELNPVGWLYAATKLQPASRGAVARRIREVGEYTDEYSMQAVALPKFFRRCFTLRVRRFLLAARAKLKWQQSRVDRTLMALILVHLHGKRSDSLSNQMRQAKAMAPDYSIRWWEERDMEPPDVDPVAYLTKRLGWRYAKGQPDFRTSAVHFGDSIVVLPRLAAKVRRGELKRASLILTSPPYFSITNYHYDQWLRLWMLGGAPTPKRGEDLSIHQKKFEHPDRYRALLLGVLGDAISLLKRGGRVYVRTDRREFTLATTHDVLRELLPRRRIRKEDRPFDRPTQTDLFGGTGGKGEVDLVV